MIDYDGHSEAYEDMDSIQEFSGKNICLYIFFIDLIYYDIFAELMKFFYNISVFSFVAGRRCPLGPGIYAFRCSRAENLFHLLQSRVRNSFIDDPSPFGDQRPDPIPREPTPPIINRRGKNILRLMVNYN